MPPTMGATSCTSLPAGKRLEEVAPIVGGKSGGRPDLAQGGGTDSLRLDEALASVPGWVERVAAG